MTFPKINNNNGNGFWNFNLGHLISIVISVASVSIAGITLYNANEKRMWKLEYDNSSQDKRLEVVESAVKETRPNVIRIDTNLDWLTKWIQNQEEAKRK